MIAKRAWIFVFSMIAMIAIIAMVTQLNRHPSPFHHENLEANLNDHIDQLTVDEMKFAIFGEPMNSSFGKSAGYLNFVRSHIVKPSTLRPRVFPAHLRTEHLRTYYGDIIDSKLKHRRNGFFIECGAADGYSISNTAFLEVERNWTGLLVEANQRCFQTLLDLNRKAYIFGGCLSPERRPRQLQFHAAGNQGGLTEQFTDMLKERITLKKSHESIYLVQCFPLNDLLAAINISHVDYFSLDVQGAELSILKTIDFTSIRIDVIILEVFENNVQKRAVMVNNANELFRKTGLYKEAVVYPTDLLFERLDV